MEIYYCLSTLAGWLYECLVSLVKQGLRKGIGSLERTAVFWHSGHSFTDEVFHISGNPWPPH